MHALLLPTVRIRLTRPPQPQVLTSSTEIEMWGDGKQTRSFTFIDDCVEGILRVTKSDVKEVCPPEGDCSISYTPTITLCSPLQRLSKRSWLAVAVIYPWLL